jgi:hypothetical protein
MSNISLNRTAHFPFQSALLEIRCRLKAALVRNWEQAVRQAERPGRYVPYC